MDSSVSYYCCSHIWAGGLQLCCFATTCLCYHVNIQRKRTLKKEDQVSKQVDTVSQKKEKSPEYEEIFLQNHPQFHIVKNIAYASNDWHWVCKIVNCELYYYSTNCTATTSLFETFSSWTKNLVCGTDIQL